MIPEPDPKAAMELRGMATRDAILKRAEAVAPTERVRPPTLADIPTLSTAEKAIARGAEAVFQPETPRTWAGKAMEETVLAEAQDLSLAPPRALECRPVRRPGDPLGPRAAVLRARPRALDVAGRPLVGPMADVVAQVSRDTITQYEKAARYRFVRDLAGGDRGLETAMTRLRGVRQQGLARGDGTGLHPKGLSEVARPFRGNEGLAPFEPAIDVPFEPRVKLDRAIALIRQEVAKGRAELRASRASAMSERVYNYSDPFPSQPGMDRLTPRGRILESVEGTSGAVRTVDSKRLAEWSASGKAPTRATLRPVEVAPFAREGLVISGPRPSLGTQVEAAASRAQLSGASISSPRIGGILIGASRPQHPGAGYST